jgi:hypothetical protein
MAYRALPLFGFKIDAEALAKYVANEFQRISAAFESPVKRRVYDATNVAPDKADDGELRRSDGTNWATRFGAGMYFYSTTDVEWKGIVHVGSGGAVTQLTNKAQGVTLSKNTGDITMNNANLAANTAVSFTLTNTTLKAHDRLVLNHVSGGTLGSYNFNAQVSAGSAVINVRNVTAGALAEAIVVGFTRVPGAIA